MCLLPLIPLLKATGNILCPRFVVIVDSFGSREGSQGVAEVSLRHQRRLAVTLREHVLRLLTLAMAAVADDRQAHLLIRGVLATKHSLESRGERLKFGLFDQA